MLPDLAGMAGITLSALGEHPELALGVEFHLRTDAAFHQTEMFVGHNRRALQALRDLGVRRGPARACAHMGVELLIDAQLVTDPDYWSAYHEALVWGVEAFPVWSTTKIGATNSTMSFVARLKLRGLLSILLERGRGVFEGSLERIHARLHGALAHRQRLAPSDPELQLISAWLAVDMEVQADVPRLLRELECLRDAAKALKIA